MRFYLPKDKNYRRLFLAQVISLAGTGVSTIALALLAHKLTGERAGVVLGIALSLKMLVYVFATPIIAAFVTRWPHKKLLISADLLRAFIVLTFFFVTEVWQIYGLIVFLNLGAVAFTPIFQASIADLLPDEGDYNQALSLSRIAYDLENILSPALAGVLLLITSFSTLFVLDSVTFLLSAMILITVTLPKVQRSKAPERFWYRLGFGITSYLKTPRLRLALLLLWVVAMASAMVIVNTVIIVRESLQGSEAQVANAFVFSGIGSIVAALILPSLLRHYQEKIAMLVGTTLLSLGLAGGFFASNLVLLFLVWFWLGCGWSLVQTPVGQLIRKSSLPEDRGDYYSAQFALSHFGWLMAYPLVGFLGNSLGIYPLFLLLSAIALGTLVIVALLWRREYDPGVLEHSHAQITHSHLHEHDEHHQHNHSAGEHRHEHQHGKLRHTHYFVIDHHHRVWPT